MKDIRGRGTSSNGASRFDFQKFEMDLSNYGWIDEDDVSTLKTEVIKDNSKSILTENKSPDIPFRFSLNAYRGCEHGCSYCYARPTHEYLGLSAGLDFESKIFVKYRAPELLHEAFMSKSWNPDAVTMSGVTDCYQPLERKLEITRRCLEVFLKFKNPVSIITKNHLILRDLDILTELGKLNLVQVFISVTSLDGKLARKLEPRTSSPQARLKAISEMAQAGIPVGVNVAPVIPGLTDHELPMILKAASEAGASSAGYGLLRLPYSVSELFVDWIHNHYPEKETKVLGFIREVRAGKLNDSEFKSRMVGEGKRAKALAQMFSLFERKYGLDRSRVTLSTDQFARPGDQLSLL